ncbi:tape measure protein [Pararhizobium sp. DWP3-4]|uniref:tape measure protein n=1 Tax=Pararhizobium sp. DWP3-4 TaxID=2804565 RepID=UPI003CF518DB
MATDVEKLVVQLSADIKQYQREMQRAQGVTNSQARAIENRYRQMDKRLGAIGQSAARSLIVPLTGIAAAISVKEVLGYADAWTSAKNSLAVAGIVGSNQADVLDRLYQSAQANAAPVGALADLFGKAAQASDNLGASQDDLIKFSDGVATALKVSGASAAQSSGALAQLGQLLGSARVQAEEFNSVNEGARPILIAVAAGLDAAGGSVNKLKQLVNDGKVSGQQFFQAFIKGLPQIQSMAANSTQTIEQGVTKISNAFTKYIGETDASLGASQRLVGGLNALADNFDQTADIVLKVAGIIAGALAGRSLGLMIAKLGLATSVVARFVAALRAATTVGSLSTALGGLSAAAGPVGLVIGGAVVGALALFSASSGEAGAGADRFAERLKHLETSADAAATGVEDAGKRADEALKNALAGEVDAATGQLADIRQEAINLLDAFSQVQSMSLITPSQYAELSRLKEGVENGSIAAEDARQSLFRMANADYNFQEVADAIAPVLAQLALISAGAKQARADLASVGGPTITEDRDSRVQKDPYFQSREAGNAFLRDAQRRNSLTKEQLALETEIARVRKDIPSGAFLTDKQIAALAEANIAADKSRSASSKSTAAKPVKATADSRFNDDIQAVRDRTAALIEEQKTVGASFEAQERRRMALDLEQSALADLREEARKKGQTDLDNIKLSDEQRAKIDAASAAYAEQADVLRRLEDQQQRNEQAAGEFYDAFKSGAMEAITGAESLGDALSGLAKRFSELFLSAAFDGLFKPASSGESGGLFSGIFKSLGSLLPGRERGGPVQKGKPYIVGEKRPEVFVPTQSGRIVPQVPSLPSLSGVRQGGMAVSATFAPSIDARGASVEAVARLEQALTRQQADFSANVVQTIRKANAGGTKFGKFH